jgi:aminoglycoside phosphotransferase (APT) family kinase protein
MDLELVDGDGPFGARLDRARHRATGRQRDAGRLGIRRRSALGHFDALPGVPVPEAGDAGFAGPQFPAIARSMGELLATFRRLPTAGLELNDLWADPSRLAARAIRWGQEIRGLSTAERTTLTGVIGRVPALFAKRSVVLAHGDFAPVNMLTDGTTVTGLLDFESVRLADPVFDVAWLGVGGELRVALGSRSGVATIPGRGGHRRHGSATACSRPFAPGAPHARAPRRRYKPRS